MSKLKQRLGRWGEQLAAEYLLARGYTIVAYNVRTPYGEIDLIAEQKRMPSDTSDAGREPVIVFIEVKTRSSTTYGSPEDAITSKKQTHMIDSALAYLQAHPEIEADWRIDVIAIQGNQTSKEPQIIHFKNALTSG